MMPGHDMTIAAVGGVILWFGWYGFNPGSTLSAMDAAGCGRVAANTTLAACARRSLGPRVHVPAQQGLGLRHDRQRLPRRPRRHHLPLLLGLARRRDHHRRRSPASSASTAIDLMEWLRIDDPVGAVAGPRLLRHLGNAEPRPLRLRQVRRRRPDGRGQLGASVSPACSTAAARRSSIAQLHRQRGDHRGDRSSVAWSSCTRSRRPARSASPRKASSKGSTSTSTAARRTPRFSSAPVSRRPRAVALGRAASRRPQPRMSSIPLEQHGWRLRSERRGRSDEAWAALGFEWPATGAEAAVDCGDADDTGVDCGCAGVLRSPSRPPVGGHLSLE